MKGWLVVNGFLKSAKFEEIYNFLSESAQKLNIQLRRVYSHQLLFTGSFLSQMDKPDFVLFWDKDVALAKRLENAGFRLFNSADGVAICDNKILTTLALENTVAMPKTLFSPKTFPGVGYDDLSFVSQAVSQLGLPLVIKEACGSFGQQVYLAETLQQAQETVLSLQGKDFLFQQFVAESRGKDVRVNVVGGKAVNAILRQSERDFRSNLTLGGKMQRHTLSDAEAEIAETACRKIGLDFAGVDVLFGKDGPVLCEVNSNPHFKTTLVCTGLDLSRNILQHIKDCLN